MNSQLQYPLLKRLLMPFLFICTIVLHFPVMAQEKPPRPIKVTVSTAQHLNFGSIIPTSNNGGTVSVDYTGSPTPSGDILLLHSYECTAALFIVDAEPGVLINIVYPDPFPKLNKSGFNMQLQLGEPNIDSQFSTQFVTKTKTTYVYIGGILTVGSLSANPAGAYSGTFQVNFIQQ